MSTPSLNPSPLSSLAKTLNLWPLFFAKGLPLWTCFLGCFLSASAWAEEIINLQPTMVEATPISKELYPRSFFWPTTSKTLPSVARSGPLGNALNQLGGIQAREQGSPTFSIRGSGHAGRVLTLFNDIPLNFSTGFGTPNIFLPREVLQNVGVVKGPSSLFYGSQALGGSLHFSSQFLDRPIVTLSLSDTDESFLPWKDGGLAQHSLAVVYPILHTKSSKLQMSLFTENNDGLFPYKKDGVGAFRKNNNAHLNRMTVQGQQTWSSVDLKYDLLWANELKNSPGPTTFPVRTEQNTEGFIAHLKPTFSLGKKVKFMANSSYMQQDSTFLESGLPSFFKQKTFIQQTGVHIDNRRMQFRLFFDYFNHQMESNFYGRVFQEKRFELAPVATYNLSRRWTAVLGARYLLDADKWVTTSRLTYSTGGHDVWASVAEGYRVGTLSDKFGDSPFSVGNPDILPESSTQWELGYRWENKPLKPTTYVWKWRTQVQVHSTDFKNFFDSQTVAGQKIKKINGFAGSSHGADVDFRAAWGPWALAGEYNYLKTISQVGEPFRLAPEHQWTARLDHYIGPFVLQIKHTLWHNFYDRGFDGLLKKLPQWQHWGLALESFAFQNGNLSLGVDNVFAASSQLTLNYPEPERRYWLQIRREF